MASVEDGVDEKRPAQSSGQWAGVEDRGGRRQATSLRLGLEDLAA